MHGTRELIGKYSMDQPLAVNPRFTDKMTRYHFNPEMALTAVTGTRVPLMEMGFIHHNDMRRLQAFLQLSRDRRGDRSVR